MISINTVRNTTLFLLNKNNKGYIGVEEFNMFCHLAQAEIFENLFFQYNQWINRQNGRKSGTEYADLPKNLREQIDVFAAYTDSSNFTYDSVKDLWKFNGSDLYRAENLSLVKGSKKIDIEEVQKRELNVLKNSKDTTPSELFPVYERVGADFRVYPKVSAGSSVEMFYLRRPKTPKWTFVNVNGNPIYNASASDHQDIELHISLYPTFMEKLLTYAGLSIREQEVQQIANSEEAKTTQTQV